MSDHSVDKRVDDLKGLNEAVDPFIDDIEHTSVEEEKVDDINDKDMHYDGEDKKLHRNCRENDVTGVEQLQPSM